MATTAPLILVADDDADILALISLRLGRLGYRVAQAADGEEALAEAAREPPALAVVDAMMPRLDGLELIRRLHAAPETAELPVILISAMARTADVEAGLAAGADVYLAKPFRAEELVAAVRQLIGEPRP